MLYLKDFVYPSKLRGAKNWNLIICIHISNHHVAPLKYTQFLLVNYTSIKLEKNGDENLPVKPSRPEVEMFL